MASADGRAARIEPVVRGEMTGPVAVTVTWWGHASATVEARGVRLLTDPLFAANLVHLRRQGSAVPGPEARMADAVLISHLHSDHLHLPTLRSLPPQTRILAPRGTLAMLRRAAPELCDRVEEISIGADRAVGALTVRAVPAAHDGRRHPWSRFAAETIGYRIAGGGRPLVWFAGDTGLFPGLAEVGPVPLAVVPVGGWGPTLGPEHLDPAEAAEAVRRIGAVHAVPVHYGTFWPAGLRWARPAGYQHRFRDPGDRFAAELWGTRCRAHVLRPGQSMTVEVGG